MYRYIYIYILILCGASLPALAREIDHKEACHPWVSRGGEGGRRGD
jgi:hypothetical protein